MVAVAALLCCCDGTPPAGCNCELTALTVTWSGSIEYAATCGVCTPGEFQEYWTTSAVASHDDKTVIQTLPRAGDICIGFGNILTDRNGADAGSECTPPDPPAVIEFPQDPLDDTIWYVRLRFFGPSVVLTGGGDPDYYVVTVTGTGTIDVGSTWSLEFRLDYDPEVACPMVGTYTYNAATSTEPTNGACAGLAPSWSFGSFSAGSVTVT